MNTRFCDRSDSQIEMLGLVSHLAELQLRLQQPEVISI